MISEYDVEPVRGLPAPLPPGETVLWQGAPDRRSLARTAFHSRLVAGYFGLLALWSLAASLSDGIDSPRDLAGVAMTILAGMAAVGLLHLLAWGSARSTVYTLTDRRLVLRIGMALPKCVNLPLGLVGAVDLAARADGTGDVALAVTGRQRLGYVALWPHARAWKIGNPQPTLRAIADARKVAAVIADACLAANPTGRIAIADHAMARPTPSFAEAAVA